jgi:hypothetical protein
MPPWLACICLSIRLSSWLIQFLTIGGYKAILSALTAPNAELRWRAADAIAAIAQNNPACHVILKQKGVLPTLMSCLAIEEHQQVRRLTCAVLYYCIVLYCIALYCIVLHCIVLVLYCIVLHCIVLYCIVLDWIGLHCIALHYIVLYCIALYCIALYCIVLYCIVLYCIVLYCIVLHCVVLYCIVLDCTVHAFCVLIASCCCSCVQALTKLVRALSSLLRGESEFVSEFLGYEGPAVLSSALGRVTDPACFTKVCFFVRNMTEHEAFIGLLGLPLSIDRFS